MIRHILIGSSLMASLCLAALCPAQSAQPTQSDEDSPRAIVLTQSKGYQHNVVKPGDDQPSLAQRVLSDLAEDGAFEPTFITDASKLTAETLVETDLVIFYTTGKLPLDVEAFDQWVRDGGAFLGIHPATDTLKNNQTYGNLIGAVFNGHPWGAGSTVTIKVHEQRPATRPFQTKKTFKEEIYHYKNFDPENVRVLMSLDMEKTQKKRPEHVPITWVKRHGEGKVFYTSLGHRADLWKSKAYQTHLAAAIDWLLGETDHSAEPNPDLSEREAEIAKDAAS